jgi:mRNA interferase MazF
VKRGEIWIAAGGAPYASKPRPVVIVQDDRFDSTKSVVVCALTSNPLDAPLMRLPIEPDETNRLQRPSRLMVDKILTLQRSRLHSRIGRLSEEDMLKLGRAITVFLGIAS